MMASNGSVKGGYKVIINLPLSNQKVQSDFVLFPPVYGRQTKKRGNDMCHWGFVLVNFSTNIDRIA